MEPGGQPAFRRESGHGRPGPDQHVLGREKSEPAGHPAETVEVGDNVTTGAGSVLRHEVPSDSMVYSENTQHNVEGWKPAWER